MAVSSDGVASGGRRTRPDLADQSFFTAMAVALAAFIAIGFAQWSLRGFVSLATTPWWVHAHGAFMLTWLGLFVTQNLLAERGAFAAHRRLGWAATFAVAGTGVFGSFAGLQALALHRIPPFFTNAYFLALTQVEILLFVATVVWAVLERRHTQWHRRLMLAATIVLMEPALGRLLPMPLLGAWGEWLSMAIQLLVVIALARHDRRTLAAVHPATLGAAGIVILSHVAVTGLAAVPAFADLANRLAGA